MSPDPVRVGFTGTRHGMSRNQRSRIASELRGLLEGAPSGEFHHGDCLGADEEAASVADRLGYRVVGHPPTNPVLRARYPSAEERNPLPYLERNRVIVDGCDVLLAAPEGPETVRSGTWSTVRYARSSGTRVVVVEREE